MMSNNGLMIYKNIRLTFIEKTKITLSELLLLIVLVPCSCLVFTYWSEMPILIKIFWPILMVVTFIGIISTPLNGLLITKKGNILFLCDIRLKKFNVKDLENISIVFTEWENNKYSVMVKFRYTNGKSFCKDYSKQFRNMKNKKLAMSMYTITKRKVERICNKLLDLDICAITIIDKNSIIICQSK